MKIKLDENLPARLVSLLAVLGHDVDTVPQQGLRASLDPPVWDAAQRNGRFLITQDLDFSDVRRFAPGTHHGLLLVRLHSPGREALVRRVVYLFEHENAASWNRCFVVATDSKVRVLRPKSP